MHTNSIPAWESFPSFSTPLIFDSTIKILISLAAATIVSSQPEVDCFFLLEKRRNATKAYEKNGMPSLPVRAKIVFQSSIWLQGALEDLRAKL